MSFPYEYKLAGKANPDNPLVKLWEKKHKKLVQIILEIQREAKEFETKLAEEAQDDRAFKFGD